MLRPRSFAMGPKATLTVRVSGAAIGLLLTLSPLAHAKSFPDEVDKTFLPPEPRFERNDDCSPIEAPTYMGPVRRQGDYAYCYAYATSDIISQRTHVQVSALDVAANFYFGRTDLLARSTDPIVQEYIKTHPSWLDLIHKHRKDVDITVVKKSTVPYLDRLEGGEEDTATLLSNVKGLCPDADLPGDQAYESYKGMMDGLRKAHTAAPLNDEVGPVHEAYSKFRGRKADAFNMLWLNQVDNQCHRVQAPVPLVPVAYRIADSFEDFLKRSKRHAFNSPVEKNKMMSMIDYALDHGRTPAIGYSFFILQKHTADDPDLFGDHSSTVVARHKSNGQCYYQIRENTGTKCEEMDPQLRPESRCKDGYIWLSEEEITRTMYSVIYLR